MTSQILNFGSPAPIDVQVRGRDMAGNQAYAHKLIKRLRSVPGLADARIQQSMRYPQIDVDVDRARMAQYGLDQSDVTQSLGIGLAGTSRSEERSVGKGCVRACRSRWSPYQLKNKHQQVNETIDKSHY